MDKQDLIRKELVTPEARIDVFLFQETFLTVDKLRRHKLIGYHLYHRQRDDNGTQSIGGATVGVRDDRRWLHKEVHTEVHTRGSAHTEVHTQGSAQGSTHGPRKDAPSKALLYA